MYQDITLTEGIFTVRILKLFYFVTIPKPQHLISKRKDLHLFHLQNLNAKLFFAVNFVNTMKHFNYFVFRFPLPADFPLVACPFPSVFPPVDKKANPITILIVTANQNVKNL